MTTIFILPLERLENRYSGQWYDEIPKRLKEEAEKLGRTVSSWPDEKSWVDSGSHSDVDIVNIPGDLPEQTATAGAFLNFASTNVWKSTQLARFALLIHKGLVPAKSKVFLTDSWNPAIIQIRYMSDLLGLDLEVHGQWHAGQHDPQDFLGRNKKVAEWAPAFEKSLYQAIDKNYFTTNFYLNMFAKAFDIQPPNDKMIRTGYPNLHLVSELKPYVRPIVERKHPKPIILFPHRIAPEKQLDIFEDLANSMPEYEWIVCQKQPFTKAQYHDLLGRTTLVWSAALQETHGIAQTEAVLARAMPLNPNRLSYREMYYGQWVYPSEWTTNFPTYVLHKFEVTGRIRALVDWYFSKPKEAESALAEQQRFLERNYIDAPLLWKNLLENGGQ